MLGEESRPVGAGTRQAQRFHVTQRSPGGETHTSENMRKRQRQRRALTANGSTSHIICHPTITWKSVRTVVVVRVERWSGWGGDWCARGWGRLRVDWCGCGWGGMRCVESWLVCLRLGWCGGWGWGWGKDAVGRVDWCGCGWGAVGGELIGVVACIGWIVDWCGWGWGRWIVDWCGWGRGGVCWVKSWLVWLGVGWVDGPTWCEKGGGFWGGALLAWLQWRWHPTRPGTTRPTRHPRSSLDSSRPCVHRRPAKKITYVNKKKLRHYARSDSLDYIKHWRVHRFPSLFSPRIISKCTTIFGRKNK